MSTRVPSTCSFNRNPILHNKRQIAEQGRESFPVVAGTLLCVAIIAAIGKEALGEHTSCKEWDREVSEVELRVKEANLTAQVAKDIYQNQAELNCDSDSKPGLPYIPRHPESIAFCKDYPKDKIPSFWKMDSGLCDSQDMQRQQLSRQPGMKLTCYAKQAIKTEAYFQKKQTHLAHKVAQKSFFCTRGR